MSVEIVTSPPETSLPWSDEPEWSLLRRIGNTPLVEIRKIFRSSRIRILAKLEGANPSGSVKMRPAYAMIREAEVEGKLRPGQTIVDATSGNTGIAYALIAAERGYRLRLALPANASPERRRTLECYGARLILTDPLQGSDGAIEVVREMVERHPGDYFYPDQYGNDANWRAHYHSTAPEIFRQSEGRVTHLVAGLGTSGTFVGTARGLADLKPGIEYVSFMPDAPLHGLEGLKHLPTASVPPIYDPTLASVHLQVRTEAAQQMVRRLAREEGLFVGVSSGGALVAALEVARNIDQGTIVTIFPDGGDRYLSESFWEGTGP